MTAQEIRIVQESFPAVQDVAGPMSQLFYGRLFLLVPAARSMFRGDMRAQRKKFTDMLISLVESLKNFEVQLPALRALGQRHVGYGVKPEHYDSLTSAFLWALSQTLEADFTPEVKSAWAALLGEVNQAMMAGAAEVS